jgi:hypothetical protein
MFISIYVKECKGKNGGDGKNVIVMDFGKASPLMPHENEDFKFV